MSMTPPPPPPAAQTQPARPHPKGTLVLILGIASLFFCGIILGVVAFILGNNAIKEIDANPGVYSNRGMVNAGRILGAIGFLIGLVLLIAVATR